jgi:hypothetical protein
VQHNLGCGMKTTADRPFADADKAVRQLVEIANATEVVQDGRIFVEQINSAFLRAGGSPSEYRDVLERALAEGLAMAAREWHLREVYPGRCGAVRMTCLRCEGCRCFLRRPPIEAEGVIP